MGGDTMRPLIVGGGPAGAAAAITLADRGVPSTVLERRPADRTPGSVCGGLLTPRASEALAGLGVDARDLGPAVDTIELVAGPRRRRINWPTTSEYPAVIASRERLERELLARATLLGAEVRHGFEALDPIIERGFVRGVRGLHDGADTTVDTDLLLIADGANSTFGRALGTSRRLDWPTISSLRAMVPATGSVDAVAEFHLDLERGPGDGLPGFGWVFPTGDTMLNVGVQIASTARDAAAVNLHQLLEGLIDRVAPNHGITGDPSSLTEAAEGARTPVGDSIVPVAGPNFLVAGDAAGQASPLTGAGVESALLSGIEAGEVLTAATRTTAATLQDFVPRIRRLHGSHHKVARQIVRATGRPLGARLLARASTSGWGAETVVRYALAEFRASGGAAEAIDAIANVLVRFAPEA
jgi:flavin-dependent dehydrogenase